MKAGDKVKVNAPGDRRHGKVGTLLVLVSWRGWAVQFTGFSAWYPEDELEVVQWWRN